MNFNKDDSENDIFNETIFDIKFLKIEFQHSISETCLDVKFLKIELQDSISKIVFKCLAKAFRPKDMYFEKWTPCGFIGDGYKYVAYIYIHIYIWYMVVGPLTIGRSIAQ